MLAIGQRHTNTYFVMKSSPIMSKKHQMNLGTIHLSKIPLSPYYPILNISPHSSIKACKTAFKRQKVGNLAERS
jgi:hypothetical protein